MRIQIGKFTLCSDTWNYWLEEEFEGKDKDGKKKVTKRRASGYCWTIDKMLEDYAKRKISGSDAETMAELIAVVKQLQEDLPMLKKTAIEKDLKTMRQIQKKAKEKRQ